jgi:hypothetical protein
MYFTGFAVIFDCSKPAAFQPYPPNLKNKKLEILESKMNFPPKKNFGDTVEKPLA